MESSGYAAIFTMKAHSSLRTSPKHRLSLRGFSLVEVALAMGIVTFSLIPIFAILPVGVKTLREAMDQTVVTQIATQIQSDLLLDDMRKLSKQRIGFDDQGRRTDKLADLFYLVEVRPENPEKFNSSLQRVYPGAPDTVGQTLSLVELRIWSGPALAKLGSFSADPKSLKGGYEENLRTLILAARNWASN